jgi:Kef-type K+ transport system membrane component KefB
MAKHRHRAKDVFFCGWGLSVLAGLVTPDTRFWHVVSLLASIVATAALVVFAVGWLQARRAGDRTAEIDARFVLALGAIAAGGVAVAVESIAGTTVATIAFAVLLIPVLAAYVFVAATAPPARDAAFEDARDARTPVATPRH